MAKKHSKSASESSGVPSASFKYEVILWAVLALSIILFISNFGIAGTAGNFISSVFFGLFGLTAYIFPILLFAGTAFMIANKDNAIAVIKAAASIALFVFVCMFMELIGGDHQAKTPLDSYLYSIDHKFGGGLVGGILTWLIRPNLGVISAYVIDLIMMIICLVLITQRSIWKHVQSGGKKVYVSAKNETIRQRQQYAERKKRRIDNKVSGVSTDTSIKNSVKSRTSDNVNEIRPDPAFMQDFPIHMMGEHGRVQGQKRAVGSDISPDITPFPAPAYTAPARKQADDAEFMDSDSVDNIIPIKNQKVSLQPNLSQEGANNENVYKDTAYNDNVSLNEETGNNDNVFLNGAAYNENISFDEKDSDNKNVYFNGEENRKTNENPADQQLIETNQADTDSEADDIYDLFANTSDLFSELLPCVQSKSENSNEMAIDSAADAVADRMTQIDAEPQTPLMAQKEPDTLEMPMTEQGRNAFEESMMQQGWNDRQEIPIEDQEGLIPQEVVSARQTGNHQEASVSQALLQEDWYDEEEEAFPSAEELIAQQPQPSNTSSAKQTASTQPSGPADQSLSAKSASSSAELHNPKQTKEEIAQGVTDIDVQLHQNQPVIKREYILPPVHLLKLGDPNKTGDTRQHLQETALKLQQTLKNFGVNVTILNVSCGPSVTRYEIQPEMGVKVSKIVNLADDIKLNLAAADIRIEAPIPGKAAIGIEVPNKETVAVMFRELIESEEFGQQTSPCAFAVGKDIAGQTVVTDLCKMPHLLIAGATGSGKSVCINTIIMSIIYKANPEDVKLIMIDPKVVELSVYNGIPHLLLPVVTDPKKAAGALHWAVSEMMDRYDKFQAYGVRSLKSYNAKIKKIADIPGENKPEKMPYIVIIVDELADLMMTAPGDVEDAICRLSQLARAAGIHLIIATQRPSVNVITGLIKANMPSRIAFSVSSGIDSRTILDMNGAEKLLGKGDMLFYPQGYPKPVRVQGAFVSDAEVSEVVEFLTSQNGVSSYSSNIEAEVANAATGSGASNSASGDDRDVYFQDAAKLLIEKDKASVSMLQRYFKIGFNRAARIMDQLEEAGIVGVEEGTKPRKILMSPEEFEQYVEEVL